ncbi:hypothetical protein [Streptomyces microflavus]|uniref:hypothetical protein n=1 Tax=Streptomyces microflavus TaxID=1919 RepID=UPI0033BD91F4
MPGSSGKESLQEGNRLGGHCRAGRSAKPVNSGHTLSRRTRESHRHHPRCAMNRRRAAGAVGGIGDSWEAWAGRRDAFTWASRSAADIGAGGGVIGGVMPLPPTG